MPGPLSHILILDDDPDVAYAAQLLLRSPGRKVDLLADPRQLAPLLERFVPDVVLLDFNFTAGRTDGAEGLNILDRLRALPRPPAVIALTAYAAVALAVEAMKRGACDFITKPWDNQRLLAAVDGALTRRAADQPQAGAGADPLMGCSRAMRELRAFIASVGPTEANVMVLGENGVGKELVARAIHAASRRAGGHFLAVDMGSLPEATLESELFGHRKGSFTDARSDRAGRFQAAAGGTLFLDEIGNLPLAAQSKLLTALERREVTPLGADRAEAVDVRIVSATNLDEAKLYDASVFRPDLLFRLNTIVIRVPPLRERREDIAALLAHYLAHYQRQYGKRAYPIAAAAFDALSAHPWPGNVRALRHACERAVILAKGEAYRLADFGLQGEAVFAPVTVPMPAPTPSKISDTLQLEALERDAIVAALDRAGGNVTRAAKMLGVSRAALYRKLEKHGI
jgi:DNA-binding NtrC family response regulator